MFNETFTPAIFEQIVAEDTELIGKIVMKLRESQNDGDIVPRLVSQVVWQTKQEIARLWIESYAPEEIQALRQVSEDRPLSSRLKRLHLKQLLMSTEDAVQNILLREPTLREGVSSRAGLMIRAVSNLPITDQDRLIAEYLRIPFVVWCAFLRILANSQEMQKFYTQKWVFLDYTGGTLTLTHTTEKEALRESLPVIPGAKCQEGIGDYSLAQNAELEIHSGGSIEQSISFDPPALRDAQELIMSPKMEQQAREIIHAQDYILAWKNLFGRRGKGKEKERNAPGELVWQK